VSIVTDMAVASENIDEAKAEEARQRAAARLREGISSAEVASVNAALARSLAQLRVKRRYHKLGQPKAGRWDERGQDQVVARKGAFLRLVHGNC
jgi:hypothetical protein